MAFRGQKVKKASKRQFVGLDSTNGSVETVQEVELWWGGYSSWTMTPSVIFCILLTLSVVVVAFVYFDNLWLKLIISVCSAGIWLLEGARWAYRVFGYNYHLTTYRVVKDWGILHKCWIEVNLAKVQRVEVRRRRQEFLGGVGRVALLVDGIAPVVLEGVRQPALVAERIREQVHQARERLAIQGPSLSEGCAPSSPG